MNMKEEQRIENTDSGNVDEQNLNAVKEYIKEHCDEFMCFLTVGNYMSAYTHHDEFEDVCGYLLSSILGVQDERVRVSWMAVFTAVVFQGANHDRDICNFVRMFLLENPELMERLGLRMEKPENDEPSDITLN